MMKSKNIVLLIIAHPDDEVMWMSGWIECFQNLGLSTKCICISGKNPASPRETEFASAMQALKTEGIVVGSELIHAESQHQRLQEKISEGIDHLKLSLSEVQWIISHSPYGDEHLHPHHIQVGREARIFARSVKCDYASFAQILPPLYHYTPLVSPLLAKISDSILIGGMKCSFRYFYFLYFLSRKTISFYPPYKFVFSLSCSSEKKRQLLRSCYPSVDPEKHISGYNSLKSNMEYLFFENRSFFNLLPYFENEGINGRYVFQEVDLFRRVLNKISNYFGINYAMFAKKK